MCGYVEFTELAEKRCNEAGCEVTVSDLRLGLSEWVQLKLLPESVRILAFEEDEWIFGG